MSPPFDDDIALVLASPGVSTPGQAAPPRLPSEADGSPFFGGGSPSPLAVLREALQDDGSQQPPSLDAGFTWSSFTQPPPPLQQKHEPAAPAAAAVTAAHPQKEEPKPRGEGTWVRRAAGPKKATTIKRSSRRGAKKAAAPAPAPKRPDRKSVV